MSEFVSSLHEAFERLGRIETRRMFGGHGIYHEGRMIGLVVADTLYLKSDAETVAHFDRLQLPAFEYRRGDKTMQTSYRQAPADVFEDREEAAAWGRLAWEAALRSGHAPKARTPRTALKPKPAKSAKSAKAAKTAKAPRKAAAR
ncbi:TfoX/Sxy family protein [Variovorax sp. dw_308]|uniref:TfoX/Sxy family protein n=1 Tax=Variovorax sp. dw_308 TaxID=2721546 RepID=UPI001C46C0E4|nr:TfoX/Sxy family protein [Variovorax sp. dw_308]